MKKVAKKVSKKNESAKRASIAARWNAELVDALKNSPRYPNIQSLHRAILN